MEGRCHDFSSNLQSRKIAEGQKTDRYKKWMEIYEHTCLNLKDLGINGKRKEQ